MKVENKQSFDYNLQRIVVDFESRHLVNRPLLFVGETGVGKTAMIKRAAKVLTKKLGQEVKALFFDLHAMDPTDLIGNPYIVDGITHHAPPSILPLKGKPGYFIVVFDEVNRIMPDMQAPLYNLISNRKIGEHELSEDCIIVAMCNPTESESDGASYSTLEIDVALQERFRPYGMAPDSEGTLEYLVDTYGPEDVVYQWLASDPKLVNFKGGKGNPRAMESLTKSLMAEGGIDAMSRTSLRGIICADIGPELAAEFNNYLDLRNICTADDILFKEEAEWKSKLSAAQAQNSRFNVETSIMRAVADKYLRTDKKPKVENVIRFLEMLGAERSSAVVQMVINKVYDQKNSRSRTMQTRLHELSEKAKEINSPVREWAAQIAQAK